MVNKQAFDFFATGCFNAKVRFPGECLNNFANDNLRNGTFQEIYVSFVEYYAFKNCRGK